MVAPMQVQECVLALPAEQMECEMAKKEEKQKKPFETFSTDDESGGGGTTNPTQPGKPPIKPRDPE